MTRTKIKPAVSSAVAYGQMHLNCIKLPRQGNPPERGSLNREGKANIVSIKTMRELGLNGMNNISELSLNVVTLNEPNDTDRLKPENGCSEDNPVQSGATRTILLPAERQILTHSLCHLHGTWKTCISPAKAGKPTAREVERGAGKGMQKKRTPSCNGRDRGFNVTPRESGQTSAW